MSATMNQIILQAPAKINLFLEVTGKRPNGYHELATLFAKISLTDTITLQAQPAETEQMHLTITGPLGNALQADDSNLALRAARLFAAHFKLTLHVDIHLEKRIPMGAGLGGGSSDAGTVLLGLCKLFHQDPRELILPAAKLGADVPLFLYPETFLKGEGIGEKLTPICAKGPLPWVVLVYPDTHIPTPEVFRRLTLPSQKNVLTNLSKLDIIIEYLRKGTAATEWQPNLFNRLESAVVPYVQSVRDVKENFSALGAYPLMSGSGSTVFALTPDRKRATDLAGKMTKKGRKVFIVHFGGMNENNGNSDSLDG